MIYQHLTTGPLMVNCYILGDEQTGRAVVIDPGGNADKIQEVLVGHNLRLDAIINTHGHWDHTGGNADLKGLAGGRILIHRSEKYSGFEPDGFIGEGDRVAIGDSALEVLDTPGHSAGGISLHLPEAQAVFVGDLLFAGSIGRTDLDGGSMKTLIRSVKEKIYPLGDDTRVLTGHGPSTTVGRERKSNPFLIGV